MLNYINECVCLLKMAPLKWGFRGVLGIKGEQGGVWCNRGEKGRHPHMKHLHGGTLHPWTGESFL